MEKLQEIQESKASSQSHSSSDLSAPKLSLPAYVDSSLLSSWRSCRRKFYWQTLNSLYPTGKSVHLIAGGAFAAGMEAARRLAFSPRSDHQPSHADLLRAAYRAFVREWGDNPDFADQAKSFENTFSALAEYLLQHPPSTDIVQPLIRPDGSPTVEFTFAIPILEGPRHPETGDPFLFAGRFDLLGSYAGLPCVVDEKTTYSLGFSWDSQWDLRGQFMGYVWACQQHGYDVQTAIIRGIGIQKREIKIATSIKQYPQYLIDRWYQLLLQDLSEMVHAYRMVQQAIGWNGHPDRQFPFNFADACTAYGGCPFSTLCQAQTPESFFTSYHHYRWNPLAKQPLETDDV